MRKHEITRLEALSDAVFAFAATLLVVALEVPKTYPELIENLRGFLAFGLSFAMLVLIWVAHNSFFRRYGMQDGGTIVLNSLLLFLVLFYVYPLKFLANTFVAGITGQRGNAGEGFGFSSLDDLGHLFAIYGAGFAAVFLCLVLMYRRAGAKAEDLGLSALERFDAYALARHYSMFVLVALISIGLAELGVGLHLGVPGFVYCLLGPLCGAMGVWSARRRKALPVPVIACLLTLGLAASAWAVEPTFTDDLGQAIRGYDPVAYFTDGKPLAGQPEFSFPYQGAVWRFASAEHRDLFKANPGKYAPQYGGYCAYAVSLGKTAPIDPQAWRIVDGKLYLNKSPGIQKDWEEDVPGNIRKGDANWPKILTKK